jgi:hypothetical protein
VTVGATTNKKTKTHVISGVLVDTANASSIIFDEPIGGKTTHDLTTKNINNPAKLVASYMVRVSTRDGQYSKVRTEDGQEVAIDYEMCAKRTEKKKELITSYKLPKSEKFVPEGTKFVAVVDGEEIVLDISVITDVKKVMPVDNQYTKNAELNKYISKFDIPYDVFVEKKLAMSFNHFINELRAGEVDTIAVPKDKRKYYGSQHKHSMFLSTKTKTNFKLYEFNERYYDFYKMKGE